MRPSAWLAVVVGALAVAPAVMPPFFLQLLTEIAIVGLFATAFNLLMGFGGMVSFLVPSVEDAVALVARTKIWKLAESLGGVESLIEVPSAMTHASTSDAPFASPPNLVRL